jgi:hypothetical protein
MATKQRIDLKNSFHNTTTYIMAEEDSPGEYYADRRAIQMAKKKLCGVKDCECSKYRCVDSAIAVIPHSDGSVTFSRNGYKS